MRFTLFNTMPLSFIRLKRLYHDFLMHHTIRIVVTCFSLTLLTRLCRARIGNRLRLTHYWYSFSLCTQSILALQKPKFLAPAQSRKSSPRHEDNKKSRRKINKRHIVLLVVALEKWPSPLTYDLSRAHGKSSSRLAALSAKNVPSIASRASERASPWNNCSGELSA